MIVAVSLCLSCCTSLKPYNIFSEKSFTEMLEKSQEMNLPFCLVLYDSMGVASQEYINAIYSSGLKVEDGLFNLVNVADKENSWYVKLLAPQVLPLNCVFTATGELIDLIPGGTKESLLYTKEALNNQTANQEYHYNQMYGDNKICLISDIDNTIHLKLEVDHNENVISELDTLLIKFYYPYSLFLKLKNQLQFEDTIAARKTASELLQFDSPRDLVDYFDEFLFAQQVIDPTFSLDNGQYIEVNPIEIELMDCKRNEIVPIAIKIKNKGQRPLKISDVLMSCSCVELISKKKHLIRPKQTKTLYFEFTPDNTGDIYREVYIASNSVNSPLCSIIIRASVK